MATTAEDIRRWFDSGVKNEAAYLIVMVDTFDYEDYPVFVRPEDDIHTELTRRRMASMQRIVEVYDLGMDRDKQLKEYRSFNYPPFPTETETEDDPA